MFVYSSITINVYLGTSIPFQHKHSKIVGSNSSKKKKKESCQCICISGYQVCSKLFDVFNHLLQCYSHRVTNFSYSSHENSLVV